MNHILPTSYANIFKGFYDSAPHSKFDAVERIFMQEFGQHPDELYDDFSRIPFASASIAQVHTATIKGTNIKVAVKVQKPEISKQMEWDLLANRLVTLGFQYVFGLPLYWTVDYVESHLREEVDFINEKENSRRAFKELGHEAPKILRDYVYIPKVFDKLSTSKVLCMEFIEGVNCGDVEGLKKNNISGKEVMNVICRLFSYVTFAFNYL
jgi:aarF domain-containing kinase